MKTNDIIRLKDGVKDAVINWADTKINDLFPSKPNTRVMLKRGLSNYIAREDDRISKMIGNVMLFLGDENGTIDTDTAIDLILDMFKEMDVREYHIGMIPVTAGKGEVILNLPHNPILDMFVGDLGKVTIKAEDILELKSMFLEE